MSSKKAAAPKSKMKSLADLAGTFGTEHPVVEVKEVKVVPKPAKPPVKKAAAKPAPKIVEIEDFMGAGPIEEETVIQPTNVVQLQVKAEVTQEPEVQQAEPLEVTVDSIMEAVNEAIDNLPVTMEQQEVHLDDEDEVRLQTLEELRNIFSLLNVPYLEATWANMKTENLQDLLGLVKQDNGGSIEMAALIKQTHDEYKASLASPEMKTRMKLVEQKAADHAKIVQFFTKSLGNDIVISGAKSKEYHAMLKSAVTYIVTLTESINRIGKQLGITMPIDQFLPNGTHVPITDNMPADPRISMYVLNVVHAYIDKLSINGMLSKDIIQKNNSRIDQLEKRVKLQTESISSYQKSLEDQAAEYEKLLGNNSYSILKDARGRILRKIDAEKPLSRPTDLDLKGDIDTALFFKTPRAAESLAERLMGMRRFRGIELSVHRVSIVKV